LLTRRLLLHGQVDFPVFWDVDQLVSSFIKLLDQLMLDQVLTRQESKQKRKEKKKKDNR
jgi:hypothetical protein